MSNFNKGFIDYMQKVAQSFDEAGSTFTLQPGQTLGHVVKSWNASHPGQNITVDQLIQANGGLDPTKYRAGKSYRLPSVHPANAQVQQPTQVAPATRQVANTSRPGKMVVRKQLVPGTGVDGYPARYIQIHEPAPPDKHWAVTDSFYTRSPTGSLVRDVARANINRAARNIGIVDEDKSLIPGGTVTSLGNDQMDWLRMAIQAQNGGSVPAKGSWGGARWKLGKNTDDYQTYVHPGHTYAHLPSTDKDGPLWDPSTWRVSDAARTAYWRSQGVPNSIEYTLGDWGWSTDDEGNIIVNDTYDFNDNEGKKSQPGTAYGGARAWAGRHASKGSDPASGKTKFRINLGNPAGWPAFDEQKFHAFNDPYREKFPDQYIFNPQEPKDTPEMTSQRIVMR